MNKNSNDNTSKMNMSNLNRGVRKSLIASKKDWIKRSVYEFYERNEMITIEKLKAYLSEHENLNVSKYFLLRYMHKIYWNKLLFHQCIFEKSLKKKREIVKEN